MLKPRYIIGFAGHRSGFAESTIRPVLKQILTDLQARADKLGGQAELYASVAEGADTLCVEVARELGMPVHLLLPLEESEFAKDFSTPTAWQRSQAQLATARQRPGRDSVHFVSGEATRPECYFNLAIHMLDAADVLVTVWDEAPARGLGGTAQVIAQAKALGTPVVQVTAATGAISGAEGLETCFQRDELITELNEIAGQTPSPAVPAVTDPASLYHSLDAIADAEAARFRPSLVRIIVLHAIASLLAAIVTFSGDKQNPPSHDPSRPAAPSAAPKPEKQHWLAHYRWLFTATELVLVSSALWMTTQLYRRHTQSRWIRCRFASELVRGLRTSVPLIDPLHPPVTRHDPKWKRFALSAGLLVLEHQSSDHPLQLRDQYLAIRLGDTHEDSQILHFQTKHPAAMRWWNLTGFVGTWSARLAPPFVLLSLLNKFSGKFSSNPAGWGLADNFPSWILVGFLPIALPLLAGAASGIRHALDAGRRKERYPEMVARLTEIKRALPGLQTGSSIRRAISRSEEILLDELIEWQLAVKNTGAH